MTSPTQVSQMAPTRAEQVGPEREFGIVLVCTANRIRSPILSGFLTTCVRGLPVRVRSAGLQDHRGAPPLPDAIRAARRLGVDISGHRARALQRGELTDVDLVIGFEWSHLHAAVARGGALRTRTFTVLELATLTEMMTRPPTTTDPVAGANHAVIRAHGMRRRSVAGAPRLEIFDPLGGPPAAFDELALRLRELAGRVARGLFETTGPTQTGRKARRL